jgi:flagella basal body P-ring formation protein FlgA
VLTLRQDLRRGALLEAASVTAATLDVPLQRGLGDPIEDPAGLEHMELVRDKQAGQVLYTNDIQPTLLVRKGQLIVVTMQGVPGLTITARLEALQDGRFGETVRLRNRESDRIVSAVVVGPNAARLP